MSEIILEGSSEVAPPEALVEGEPLGVWLDGQRKVAVQKAVEELRKETNPDQRKKLLGGLFILRLGKLSEEQAKVANEKLLNSTILHLETLVRCEQDPKVRELFKAWLESEKNDPRYVFPKPALINQMLEIDSIKQALERESFSLETRHVLYLELFTRMTSMLSSEMKEKLPHDEKIRFFLPGRTILKIHAEMVENAKRLQVQELSHVLKAAIAGKELPKMSFPLLQIFELEKRCGVALSKTALLEEEFRFIKAFSMGEYPFLSFSVEAKKGLQSLSKEIVKSAENAIHSYKNLIDQKVVNCRDIYGKVALLSLYRQGKLFEGELFKMAMKFYCSSRHSTPEEGVKIIKALCYAARAIIAENPAVGKDLLPLIKRAYIDEQLYLSWFSSAQWSGCRAHALLELGKLAHEINLPDIEHALTEEAAVLLRKAEFSKSSDLKKEYAYSYSKETWFIP